MYARIGRSAGRKEAGRQGSQTVGGRAGGQAGGGRAGGQAGIEAEAEAEAGRWVCVRRYVHMHAFMNGYACMSVGMQVCKCAGYVNP